MTVPRVTLVEVIQQACRGRSTAPFMKEMGGGSGESSQDKMGSS